MTIASMATEMGGIIALIPPSRAILEYCSSAGGRTVDAVVADPDAEYVKVIELDASAIRPMVALPGDPGNGLYMDELADEPIRIDMAYAGSCTAGILKGRSGYANNLIESSPTA